MTTSFALTIREDDLVHGVEANSVGVMLAVPVPSFGPDPVVRRRRHPARTHALRAVGGAAGDVHRDRPASL